MKSTTSTPKVLSVKKTAGRRSNCLESLPSLGIRHKNHFRHRLQLIPDSKRGEKRTSPPQTFEFAALLDTFTEHSLGVKA